MPKGLLRIYNRRLKAYRTWRMTQDVHDWYWVIAWDRAYHSYQQSKTSWA